MLLYTSAPLHLFDNFRLHAASEPKVNFRFICNHIKTKINRYFWFLTAFNIGYLSSCDFSFHCNNIQAWGVTGLRNEDAKQQTKKLYSVKVTRKNDVIRLQIHSVILVMNCVFLQNVSRLNKSFLSSLHACVWYWGINPKATWSN